jgi:hypothetical protein
MFGSPPEDYKPTPITLPESTDPTGKPITVGTRVRSFDFARGRRGRSVEGPEACYIEGTIVGAVEHFGCPSYSIRIERRVFSGWERTDDLGVITHPPVNGARTMLGGRTTGVDVIGA